MDYCCHRVNEHAMGIITELEGKKVGEVYVLTAGWHKGQRYKLEYISPHALHRMTSGTLQATGTTINALFTHLGETADQASHKAANVRKMAQKLLQQGKREQALKLLKTLR